MERGLRPASRQARRKCTPVEPPKPKPGEAHHGSALSRAVPEAVRPAPRAGAPPYPFTPARRNANNARSSFRNPFGSSGGSSTSRSKKSPASNDARRSGWM